MATRRKFKRDYIILEAKDMNFRYRERVEPKAFAKVEINNEKCIVAIYVENLKPVKEEYKIVAIRSDYETIELGNIILSEQGKGEYTFNLEEMDSEIKGVAFLYDKIVPLVGFKGTKIDNYEEILFAGEEEYEYIEVDDDEFEEYEEIEYIEVDDDEEFEEYEEIESIEVEEDDECDKDDEYERQVRVENKQQEPSVEARKNIPTTKPVNKNKQERIDSDLNINYFNQEQEYEEDKEVKSSGALLMPRQIKKGLKMFKEVKPFAKDYIENTRWWKIEINPMTLCGYTMPHLGYVNTLNYTMYSDSVMQSYKYRHYLFGVQYDEYNKRKNYIYAIPGKKDEQPDKGQTGYNRYQPCDMRNDNLGYWLCLVDCRTRKILK